MVCSLAVCRRFALEVLTVLLHMMGICLLPIIASLHALLLQDCTSMGPQTHPPSLAGSKGGSIGRRVVLSLRLCLLLLDEGLTFLPLLTST